MSVTPVTVCHVKTQGSGGDRGTRRAPARPPPTVPPALREEASAAPSVAVAWSGASAPLELVVGTSRAVIAPPAPPPIGLLGEIGGVPRLTLLRVLPPPPPPPVPALLLLPPPPTLARLTPLSESIEALSRLSAWVQ